jgi:VWFA-related protein
MMRVKLQSFILTFGVAAAISTPLAAQNGGAGETVIRVESREVVVDTTVVDKNGTFVPGLAQKDFRVLEDGKEQRITAVSIMSAGTSPTSSEKHYIALFFDASTMPQADRTTVRQEASRFVASFASPDRYMAVVDFNGNLQIQQNFTTDVNGLKNALAQNRGTMAGSGGYSDLLESLREVAESLGRIRGRKVLVLFSAGTKILTGGANGAADLHGEIRSAIEACNKADVGIYSVGVGIARGQDAAIAKAPAPRIPGMVIQPQSDTPADLDPLKVLADGTGGETFATVNGLSESLGKIALEQDRYYLLTYSPAIDSPEGKCHELNVKVDRRNVDVRSRQGYCTSKPENAIPGKIAGEDLKKSAAAQADTGNIRMQLPWFYSGPNLARVRMSLDIVPAAMKLQTDKGRFHGDYEIVGVARKPDDSVAAQFTKTIHLDFDKQQAEAFLKSSYHYINEFRIAPGKYKVSVAIGVDGKAFGKIEKSLDIDSWTGESLSMSGVALSREAKPVADLASGLESSLLIGTQPLIVKGSEIIPAGSSEYYSGETGSVYFEIYEPLISGNTVPLIGIRIRVLDVPGGASKFDTGVKIATSFVRPGNPVVPVVSPIPIATLPAGTYTLEVSAMRQTGAPVVRTSEFKITR